MLRQRVILKASMALLYCLVSLSNPAQSFADSPKEGRNVPWKFSKQIGLESSAAYQQFYLDEEVYGQAASDLRDLRIVDGKGEFVPFYIESGAESTEGRTVSYASNLIRTVKKGMDTLFDYQIIPVKDNVDIQGNVLVFELPKEAFLKHVQVFGSYDGNVWEPLEKADLYSTEGRIQDRIELATTYKFTYYRLWVNDNMEDLDFGTLQLSYNNTELKTTHFLRQQTLNYEMKQEGNQTVILVHNKDHLKVSKVLIESTGHFTRRYELLDDTGAGVETTKGRGELYRLDFKDARIEGTDVVPSKVMISPSFSIVINNQDDAPINISGISVQYLVDKLVFAESGQAPYQLLYGNIKANTPQYDISNFKNLIEAEDVGLAKLEVEKASQEGITANVSAKTNGIHSKIGFNIVIIVVSLLLIIILARKLTSR